MTGSRTIATIVASDLCIGCGLCEAATGGRVRMVMTPAGSLRPSPVDGFTPEEEAQLVAACPGAVAEARVEVGCSSDPVWGAYRSMARAWAARPDVRYRGATGGVLTALGMNALRSGRGDFVLHVGADPDQPMRSRWVMSDTPESVQANTASRYGPTAPLAGLETALGRGQPFALIAKPCDLGAVHALSQTDPRVDKLCTVRLALVCGGQSRLTKSQAVLHEFGLVSAAVSRPRARKPCRRASTSIVMAPGSWTPDTAACGRSTPTRSRHRDPSRRCTSTSAASASAALRSRWSRSLDRAIHNRPLDESSG